MKTLLIVGGSGFLGSSIYDYFKYNHNIKTDIKTVLFAARRKNNIFNKRTSSFKLKFIKLNILKAKQIPKCDYIIYAANSSNNKLNIDSLKNFIKIVKNKKNLKILFTSSGAVYGPNKKKRKFLETDKLNLNNIKKFSGYKRNYAKTKIKMETMIKGLGSNGYKVSIARLFTFFGIRILNNNKYAISNILNFAMKNKKIILKSKINVFRSYMSVDDLVEWLLKILYFSNEKCPIYNVGSDKYLSIYKLAKYISNLTNSELVKHKRNLSINDFYVPNVEKAKKELNLKNRINFKSLVKKVIKLS